MESLKAVIIGNPHRREFANLIAWLGVQEDLQVIGRVSSVSAAHEDEESLVKADITIVLQSWSDEYSQSDVESLIGATLFRRLVCCYGPWCESDGRNRDFWPEANRIPVRLAERFIEWEILRIRRGLDAVPPTAAADEIFAYRLGEPDDWAPLDDISGRNAAVISPDRTLRRTASNVLKSLGLRAVDLPPLVAGARKRIRPDSSAGPVSFIIHDLDPWSEVVRDSVNAVQQVFPDCILLGVASMPDGGFAAEIDDQLFEAVIPKLDLEDSLRNALSGMARR